MEPTDRQVITIFGTKGMGKTTLALWLLSQRPKGRGPVIALDQNRQFPGGEWPEGFSYNDNVRNTWIRSITNAGRGPLVPPAPVLDREGNPIPGRFIRKRVDERGALLLLDDCDRYLPQFQSPWDDVWMANRHLRLDVLATAHRPQKVPKDLIEMSDVLCLFNIGEVHAISYLRKIDWVGEHALRMPREKGLCLWITKMPRKGERPVQLINVFALKGGRK